MAESKKVPSSNHHFLLLSLGCLIGFLVGFVLLLANLPGYETPGDYDAWETSRSATKFDFYRLLPGQRMDMVEDEDYRPSVPEFRARSGASEPSMTAIQPLKSSKVHEVPASYSTETFYLQAGSFSQQADAEKMRAKLLLEGLDAFIKPFEKDGSTYHRVRLGPYYQKDGLNHARESLQNRGINYMVLRVRG